MSTITLKQIPEALHEQLAEVARRQRRSLNQEILVALERHVGWRTVGRDALLRDIRAQRQKIARPLRAGDAQRWKESGRP